MEQDDLIKTLLVVSYLIYWVVSRFIKKKKKTSSQHESVKPKKKSIWDEFKEQIQQEIDKANEQTTGEVDEEWAPRKKHPSVQSAPEAARPAAKAAAKEASKPPEVTLEKYLEDKEQKRQEKEEDKKKQARKKATTSPFETGVSEELSEDLFAVYGDIHGDIFTDIHGDIHKDIHKKIDDATFDQDAVFDQSGAKKPREERRTERKIVHEGGLVHRLQEDYTDEQLLLVLAEVMAPYGESPHRPESD